MGNVALFLLRLTVGGLLAGHGAQKLFGWFEGPGMAGTRGMMDSIGLKPGHRWAPLAGISEFGGGLMTALGLGGPLGPIAAMGSMGMATGTVHRGKPIWVTKGGAELPVTNIAVLSALALCGPGRFSLDRMFGVRVPAWLTGIAVAATVAGMGQGLSLALQHAEMQQRQESSSAERPRDIRERPGVVEPTDEHEDTELPQAA
jgi:putative oxidoreductase